MKTLVRDLVVGFIFLAVGIFVILIWIEASGWPAFVLILTWVTLWLLFYTQHISNVAIERHEEKKCRKSLPNTADSNEDVDKLVWKDGKGQCLKM